MVLSVPANALDNVLTGGAGAQTLSGGAGQRQPTTSIASMTSLSRKLDGGIDTVVSSVDLAGIPANVENIRLTGAAHFAVGNDGSNRLSGGSGNDELDGARWRRSRTRRRWR
jgi:hypothetical protein